MAGNPYENVEESLPSKASRLEYEIMKIKAREEINRATQENKMSKDEQSKSGVNRHKRMAEGEKIELKAGGMAKKSKPKSKKK